jgi:hypothetical protein
MTVTLTLPPAVESAIQEAARQQGQTPEEAITQALHTLFAPGAPDDADQRRRREVLAGILARAQALEPEPPDSPARRAAQEDSVGEMVVEKFRRQGFHL